MVFTPNYTFEGEPPLGETMSVADGVHWLRMPLPFKLNHINLWLIEDGDGWVIVDTGIKRSEVQEAWERIFQDTMQGRPVTRVIVTHFHPDHAGLAGWLVERFDAPLLMPLTEWTFGRMLAMDGGEQTLQSYRRFYHRAGFTDEMMETVTRRLGGYGKNVAPIPAAMHRIADSDEILIGGKTWQVIVGRGHSPEHACLYCAELDVLISGDQVLPKISPNVSVWPQEPDGRPLGLFMDSLRKIDAAIPGDPLVLPSHNWPFRGLHARIADLLAHHEERLEETAAVLTEPMTGVDVLRHLFDRELDEHQTFFAIGETLAHLHMLMDRGQAIRTADAAGVDRYRLAPQEPQET